MKINLLVLSFLFVWLNGFGQDTPMSSKKYPFSDTTLLTVTLNESLDMIDLVAVEDNRNVIIYISKDSIKSFVQKKLQDSIEDKKDYLQIAYELERLKSGEIRDLKKLYSPTIRWITSEQILSGTAKIYDKLNHLYLSVVYHRMERVISDAYQTFYFSKTDRRYLFRHHAWYGIIPNELIPDIE